jgi:PilZ domain
MRTFADEKVPEESIVRPGKQGGCLMMEKRKFPRVRLSAKGVLSHDAAVLQGQLENISLTGALIRFEADIVVPKGSENIVTVYIEDEDAPLRISVEIVCTTHGLTGVKFLSCEAGTEARLRHLVDRLVSEQDSPGSDQDTFRKHLAEYLR